MRQIKAKMAPQRVLSENEAILFEKLNEDKWEEVKALINHKDVKVDCLDKNGMTPLQHACYKGNLDMCEYLIANGADVNSNYHEHGYTSLMFSALSGNTEVTRFVLEKGGSTTSTNGVGRNAAQMAAFVGQHQCVTLINNFFSREDLDYYTRPHDLETEARLKPHLAPALYKIILSSNLNPVKVSITLKENPDLLENAKQVVKLLDFLCEKMMKQKATNEVMAIKFHYQASVIKECAKCWSDNNKKLDVWFKLLLRQRPSDMFMDKQEELIRSTFKSFPYVECALLQQLIRNIAPVKIGESPTAISILNSGVNGNRMTSDDENPCTTCEELNAKKCVACKSVNYCNRDCQKLHWFTHKQFCKILAAEHKAWQEAKRKQEEEEEKRKKEKGDENADVGNPSSDSNHDTADKDQDEKISSVTTDDAEDATTPGNIETKEE